MYNYYRTLLLTLCHFSFRHFMIDHYVSLFITLRTLRKSPTSYHFSSLLRQHATFDHFSKKSLHTQSLIKTMCHFMHTCTFSHCLSLLFTFRTSSLWITFYLLLITLCLLVSVFDFSLSTSLSTAETGTKWSQVPIIT